jgi:hypothetical protein
MSLISMMSYIRVADWCAWCAYCGFLPAGCEMVFPILRLWEPQCYILKWCKCATYAVEWGLLLCPTSTHNGRGTKRSRIRSVGDNGRFMTKKFSLAACRLWVFGHFRAVEETRDQFGVLLMETQAFFRVFWLFWIRHGTISWRELLSAASPQILVKISLLIGQRFFNKAGMVGGWSWQCHPWMAARVFWW